MKFRQAIAGVLFLTMGAASCMTARKPVGEPREFIQSERPDQIWITDDEGDSYRVLGPRIFGDTLLGARVSGDDVWMALEDIHAVEARRPDVFKTAMIAVAAGAVAAIALVQASGGGSGDVDPPDPED